VRAWWGGVRHDRDHRASLPIPRATNRCDWLDECAVHQSYQCDSGFIFSRNWIAHLPCRRCSSRLQSQCGTVWRVRDVWIAFRWVALSCEVDDGGGGGGGGVAKSGLDFALQGDRDLHSSCLW